MLKKLLTQRIIEIQLLRNNRMILLNIINYRKVMILLLIFLATGLYSNELIMKITLETFVNTDEKQTIVIYHGSTSSELISTIRRARTIIFGNIEKSAIFEGCYYIEFFDGKEEKKYSIENNYWIYDINKGRYLRCSILSNLRGYLLDYLFNKGYNIS